MAEHVIGSTSELAPGDSLVIELEGREVGVFNVNGEYHAILNWCAHQGGPACEGPIGGTYEATFDRESLETHRESVKEGRVVTCPWHGWEYDIVTGECLVDPSFELPTYPVRVDNNRIIVSI